MTAAPEESRKVVGKSGPSIGWGRWHTSGLEGPCPQGDGTHTVDEAVELNGIGLRER